MQFKLDNHEEVSLEIVRKARMKHTYLRVTPKGIVVSTAKKTPLKEIEAFVLSKSSWISKHLNSMQLQQQKCAMVSGNEVYFLGKSYTLNIKEEESLPSSTVLFDSTQCNICTPYLYENSELEALLNGYYKQEAQKIIPPMVELYSEKMGLMPSNIGFRKAKRRWGSCSSQNSISFNYYLMKLPLPCIEYVVVHELAHIQEKNHSKKFWILVEKYLPNYKTTTTELREFERVITMC